MIRKYLLYYPIFWTGYLIFKITGKTYWYPYVSFRRLFVLTRGLSNDRLSVRISKTNSPYAIEETDGVLGKLKRNQIVHVADEIKKNGYYIFDAKLDQDKIDELMRFALLTQAELIPPTKDGITKSIYNRSSYLAPRYQFAEIDLMSHPLIQELVVDENFFAIAQEYLGCKPIQDLIAMWWSVPFSKEASSEAAQLFHFDMDRFKFIKFFIYLTDVNTNNGPHCFVKGSHKQLPENLWKDGRIQDKEIIKSFKKDDIIEIQGGKGSLIAVDTRGLHKGKILETGERLILQFEYTNSLFGAPYEKLNLKNSIESSRVKGFMEKYAHSFQRFKI